MFRLLQRFRVYVHVLESLCGLSNRLISTFVLQFDGSSILTDDSAYKGRSMPSYLRISLSVCILLSRFDTLIIRTNCIFSFSTKYWTISRADLFIESRKAKLISNRNISRRIRQSAQFKRVGIHIENCITARVWKLHRSVVEQITWTCTDSEVQRFHQCLKHYNLPSYQMHINISKSTSSIFDKETW